MAHGAEGLRDHPASAQNFELARRFQEATPKLVPRTHEVLLLSQNKQRLSVQMIHFRPDEKITPGAIPDTAFARTKRQLYWACILYGVNPLTSYFPSQKSHHHRRGLINCRIDIRIDFGEQE